MQTKMAPSSQYQHRRQRGGEEGHGLGNHAGPAQLPSPCDLALVASVKGAAIFASAGGYGITEVESVRGSGLE